jgi:hypothetical protein
MKYSEFVYCMLLEGWNESQHKRDSEGRFARETILGLPKAIKRYASKKRPTAYDRPLQYKLMGLTKDTTGKFGMFPQYAHGV